MTVEGGGGVVFGFFMVVASVVDEITLFPTNFLHL